MKLHFATALLASVIFATGVRGRGCGTPSMSEERKARMEEDLAATRAALALLAPRTAGTVTSIPVSFHMIHDGAAGNFADGVAAAQIAKMNQQFQGSGFEFELRDLSRHDNAVWFACSDDSDSNQAFKQELRKPEDGPDVLYLYTCRPTGDFDGWATFPVDYAGKSFDDGVAIDGRTMPGGGGADFNQGFVGTHETGHWMGLFHVFEGDSCAGAGDAVADTPAMLGATEGCPVGRDSCPDVAGLDPIDNTMDYSDEACLVGFTDGQFARMREQWLTYRAQPAATTAAPTTAPSTPPTDEPNTCPGFFSCPLESILNLFLAFLNLITFGVFSIGK